MLVLQEPGGHFEQRAVLEAGLHAHGDRIKHPVPTRPADLDGCVARDELEFLPEVVRMRVLGVVQGHEGVQGSYIIMHQSADSLYYIISGINPEMLSNLPGSGIRK